MIGCTKLLCGKATVSDLIKRGRGEIEPHLLQFSTNSKPIVIWNVTNRCNLSCKHCYIEAKDEEHKGELTTQEAKRFIDDLGKMKTPVLLFSGGEPLLQIDFVEEFCSGCREEGLSVAVETCGAVPFDSFRRILPFVDLILYDVKAVDPERHKAWTGSSNQLILSNLESLRESGIRVIPRVPIVPSYTAQASNLSQIASHLEGSFQEVHLLPYHRWGESKRDLIDSPQPTLQLDPPTDEEMEAVITDKMTRAARGGGYIYHSDHSVAPDVPFEQYLKVLDVVRRHGAC